VSDGDLMLPSERKTKRKQPPVIILAPKPDLLLLAGLEEQLEVELGHQSAAAAGKPGTTAE
jgi:hypothetical protein